jgi:hypothetical protein
MSYFNHSGSHISDKAVCYQITDYVGMKVINIKSMGKETDNVEILKNADSSHVSVCKWKLD